MVHVDYNVPLVLFSVFAAIFASYIAISVEHLIFKENNQKKEKTLLLISGLFLGLAIWSMHFIGMIACHLPSEYYFNTQLTIVSYFIAVIASTFALWLNTRPTLPTSRLIIGSVLMGLGISGMHYTGMMGLTIPNFQIIYDPLIVIFSILIAISGSGIAFLFSYRAKQTHRYKHLFRIAIAVSIGLSIVGMHYTGMASVTFMPMTNITSELLQANFSILLFIIIFITALILVIGLIVASLELRLEEKNQTLLKLNSDLSNLSIQDHLTKLPNRLFLEDYARNIFQSHRRNQQEISFLYIDLDRFKVVNDVYGHSIGDQLLIEVTLRIKEKLPQPSNLIRLGGDEFLLSLENSCLDSAIQIAEQIITTVQQEYCVYGKDLSLSASIGIAVYPIHGNNFRELLTNADMAMYLAKENGRNTYRVFNDSLDSQKTKNEFQIANDLNKAITEKQFILNYQPKFDVNEVICGVETLIRWQHPRHGLLGPQAFIDIAERTGMIIPMGYWVLQKACQQIQEWQESGQRFYPIAVNLSALQFEHNTLFLNLEHLLEKYQINPKNLIIEVTETTAMRNIELCVQSFKRLRKMGIQIAIDDFGTGYSSFSYLKDLPLDELKIDKVFITDLKENSKEETILASIIQLAIKLGLTVTAEGVETKEQADILKRLGCHQLQGFLYARPMPVEELQQFNHKLHS